jgi:hypothetical protein
MLYRKMISPDIPNMAFLQVKTTASSSSSPSPSPTTDFNNTTMMTIRSYLSGIWLSTMLYGEMRLPSSQLQRREPLHHSFTSSTYNDLLLRDLGINPPNNPNPKLIQQQQQFGTRSINSNNNSNSNEIIRGGTRIIGFTIGLLYYYCLYNYPSNNKGKDYCYYYRGILQEIQMRRKIAQKEGWAMPLVPVK